MKIIAFVASRLGSTRVPFKNVRLLEGKPLFYYLLNTALKCERIDEVYLNSDSHYIHEISREYFGAEVKEYLRPSVLGTSSASLDDYVFEFLQNVQADIIIFLNPCSPLLRSETVDAAIDYFVCRKLSSLTASEMVQTHTFKSNEPMNFSFAEPQPRSQDLDKIHLMTSGFFIWDALKFIEQYKENGYANFIEPFESYPLGKIEALDIDNEEDWRIVEGYMKLKAAGSSKPTFHNIVSEKIRNGTILVN
jgi:CMP-N,N'-diacetyllegionaminic acid synthase